MFSNCVKDLRIGVGFSQKMLAHKCAISETHLSNIESGRRGISLELGVNLANALNLNDLRDLIGGSGYKKIPIK